MEQVYIYSTASNVAVFLNGYHIEQAYGFNYKESVPKIPVYGYNDYEYSTVARGKTMVQGILVLNFVFPGYLTAVLTVRNDEFVPSLYNYNLPGTPGQYLPSTEKQVQDKIFASLETELPANEQGLSKAARAEFIANLIAKPSMKKTVGVAKGPNSSSVKQALYRLFNAQDQSSNIQKSRYSINSPLIADSKTIIGNQLDVYYQDPNMANWLVRFNNVHFTDVSQNISQAGAEGSSEPLYEIYEFMAKNKEIIEIK
jgi:hypothetical protein